MYCDSPQCRRYCHRSPIRLREQLLRTNTAGRELRKSRAIPGLGLERRKTELNQTNFATPWSTV